FIERARSRSTARCDASRRLLSSFRWSALFTSALAGASPDPFKAVLCSARCLQSLRRFSHFCVSARRSAPPFRQFGIQSALIGLFFTVYRRNVRWIFIQVGSPDPQLL